MGEQTQAVEGTAEGAVSSVPLLVCACCGKPYRFQWCDTHGVGVCVHCGLPYTIYHYEDDKRVDKPPTVAIKETWLPICKRYHEETGRRCVPGCYDMGISSGERATYSGATRDDMERWNEWCEAHRDELPKSD